MSKAIELADKKSKWTSSDCMDAAAELRRLAGVEKQLEAAQAEVKELRAALKDREDKIEGLERQLEAARAIESEAIKELKRLAEAATPGPWEVYNDNEGMEQCYSPLWCLANDSWHNASDESAPCFQMAIYSGVKEDADWIAAANPSAIKSLIAQLEAAQAELAAIRALEPVAWAYVDMWRGQEDPVDDCFFIYNRKGTVPLYALPEQK